MITGTSSQESWSRSGYWTLVKRGRTHEIFLTVACDERGYERVLPVFSAKCSANTFLEYGALDTGVWHARRMECGELISLLYGPCEKVGGVALDPDQPAAGSGIRVDLARRAFLDLLCSRGCEDGRRGMSSGSGALVGA